MNSLYLDNTNNQSPLLKIGAITFGLYALNSILTKGHDTINYSLWYKNRLVYHGICYVDRIETRLNEHEFNGLIFDQYDHDHAKPREKARAKEARLIKRDSPKYNYQHNCY